MFLSVLGFERGDGRIGLKSCRGPQLHITLHSLHIHAFMRPLHLLHLLPKHDINLCVSCLDEIPTPGGHTVTLWRPQFALILQRKKKISRNSTSFLPEGWQRLARRTQRPPVPQARAAKTGVPTTLPSQEGMLSQRILYIHLSHADFSPRLPCPFSLTHTFPHSTLFQFVCV